MYKVVSFGLATGRSIASGQGSIDGVSDGLIEMLKEAVIHAKGANGKQITVFIGNTGTGKSTAINYLSGLEMKEERMAISETSKRKRNVISTVGEPLALIGHSMTKSETRFAQIYERSVGSPVYCDCGGFMDSRGIETDISVAVSTKLTIDSATNVRLVLCMSYESIKADRATLMRQSLGLTLRRLLVNFREHENSIMLLITKAKDDGEYLSAEDVRDELSEFMEDASGPERELYEFIMRDGGKYVQVCHPLKADDRADLVASIHALKPITNTKDAFLAAFSPNAQVKLLETFVGISSRGTQLYTLFNNAKREVAAIAIESSQIADRIDTLQSSLRRIDKAGASAEEIERTKADLKTKMEEEIRTYESEIGKIESDTSRRNEAIRAHDTSISKLNTSEAVEYWVDRITESAKFETRYDVIEREEEHETGGGWGIMPFMGRLYLVPGNPRTETRTVKDIAERQEGTPISKEFNYAGPRIDRIEKSCTSGSFTDESQSEGTYRIKYISEPGEDANAVVRIFVRKKDMPTSLSQVSEARGLQSAEQQALTANLQRVHDYRLKIQDAKRTIENVDHILDRVAEFKEEIGKLESQRAKVEERLTESKYDLARKQSDLLNQESNFVFLEEFLRLSQDHSLRANESVMRFLSLRSHALETA